MHSIRYYGREIHPDQFTGWRGRIIRVLNSLRFRLELYVQTLAFRAYCAQEGVPAADQQSMTLRLRADRLALLAEAASSSPLLPAVGRDQPSRQVGYQQGRVGAVPGALPVPDSDINLMAQRYASASRAKKYARGRKRVAVGEADEFEPVPR